MTGPELIQDSSLAIQQGDIMLAGGVVRLTSSADAPMAWQTIDAVRTQMLPEFVGMRRWMRSRVVRS